MLWVRLHEEKLAEAKALNERSEEANPERSENPGEAKMKRWLIIRQYPGKGFKWMDDRELYCKVSADLAEVEDARGKKGWSVEDLEPALES
ncbi:hypothetical protein ES703_118705 [subsurface metagenome]